MPLIAMQLCVLESANSHHRSLHGPGRAPRPPGFLSDKLGLHQSSVSHALKELMEGGLVIKKGKGYLLSNVGIIQKNAQKWMVSTLRCLKDHKDFFLSHDLRGIPQAFR
jgi:predicted transcriptional regulator